MNVEKVWGARYTLGARYLSKNTVCFKKKNVYVHLERVVCCTLKNCVCYVF